MGYLVDDTLTQGNFARLFGSVNDHEYPKLELPFPAMGFDYWDESRINYGGYKYSRSLGSIR